MGYNEGVKIREVLIKGFLLVKIAPYFVIFSFFVHLANLSQLLSVVLGLKIRDWKCKEDQSRVLAL